MLQQPQPNPSICPNNPRAKAGINAAVAYLEALADAFLTCKMNQLSFTMEYCEYEPA
jgi:hypothetical protein